MATHDDLPVPDDWDEEDDDEDLADLDMEDGDLYFEDIESDDDDDDGDFYESSDRYKSFSARRRIEIAREDKWLKSAMADFDDFDGIEDLGDHFAEELSY